MRRFPIDDLRRRSQGGQETRYQYDDQSLTAETNHIGNTLKRYHYSATQLLGETLAGSTPVNRQFLLDALKTPIAVLTQTGAISARTRYDAWGRIVSQTNDTGNTVTPNRDAPFAALPGLDGQPFGFTGYVKDGESGLYYANARYYDPATARFTTEDPEAGKDLTPPSLHRYLYAYANPTVYTDRTGRQAYDDDVEKAAMVLGWNDEQYHNALEVQTEARAETSGTYYGAGKLTAKALWATAKYSAGLAGKMLFDIGDAKDIVEPPVQAVAATVDAVRAGPEGVTEYYAEKSLKAEKLRREGRHFEAGELYGPELAAVAGTSVQLSRTGGRSRVATTTAATVRDTADVATLERSIDADLRGFERGGHEPKTSVVEPFVVTEAADRGVAVRSGSGQTAVPEPQWLVGRHGDMPSPRPTGYESHRGVNTVWMERNVPSSRASDAPAVLMKNDPFHNATRGVFNRFRSEMAARQRVSSRDIDWSKVSPGSAWRLAEEQFAAASVPGAVLLEYWERFNTYMGTLKK